MKIFTGILAGGSGERLWPLSTQEHPKQLIPFIHNKSLLTLTTDRLISCATPDQEIFVIACKPLIPLLQKHGGQAINFFVEEPASRNTAPAILLSCLEIYKRDPEAVVAFFPADHFIPDVQAFQAVLSAAVEHVAKHNVIATLGIKPTFPATGYGYIQAARSACGDTFYPALKFHEKPELAQAQQYAACGDMFWNAGMFLGKASLFLEEFQTHSPALWQQFERYVAGELPYVQLEKISVDYAIMEKSKKLVVFPASFEWYDVGNIHTFLALKNKFEKTSTREIAINAHNNLASTQKKTVVWVGVQNLCVIETVNELLIVSQDRVEEVKKVVQYLNNEINSST